MEGLLTIVIMAMVHIAMIFFDPFVLACKTAWGFWKFFDPDSQPEQLGFEDHNYKNWNEAAPGDAVEFTPE